MKKHAVIDIGTNSMRLLLATIKEGQITDRQKYINTTRIGSSVDKNKIISKEGIERNLEALYDFAQKSQQYGAEKITAIATSAVRDAQNRQDFIKQAYEKTGVNIRVISGDEEATLGYKGVIMGLREHGKNGSPCLAKAQDTREGSAYTSSKPTIVIDIGGGSTELIIGQGSQLQQTISLDIGAVRMTERFIGTNPVNMKEYREMERAIQEIIEDVKQQVILVPTDIDACNKIYTNSNQKNNGARNRDTGKGIAQIGEITHAGLMSAGIGGTITTLAALDQELDPYNPNKVHNYKLSIEDVNNIKKKLLTLTIDEIKELKGIHPKRADIITAGTTILYIIMKGLDLKEITISEYDNLEGVLFDCLLF